MSVVADETDTTTSTAGGDEAGGAGGCALTDGQLSEALGGFRVDRSEQVDDVVTCAYEGEFERDGEGTGFGAHVVVVAYRDAGDGADNLKAVQERGEPLDVGDEAAVDGTLGAMRVGDSYYVVNVRDDRNRRSESAVEEVLQAVVAAHG